MNSGIELNKIDQRNARMTAVDRLNFLTKPELSLNLPRSIKTTPVTAMLNSVHDAETHIFHVGIVTVLKRNIPLALCSIEDSCIHDKQISEKIYS